MEKTWIGRYVKKNLRFEIFQSSVRTFNNLDFRKKKELM
jgi:hypothetical protein